MTIDQSTLTKGQIRKLNALRKSVGDDIAEDAFSKWMKSQAKSPKEVRDPVADALVAALSNLTSDKSFKLGNKGYLVKRSYDEIITISAEAWNKLIDQPWRIMSIGLRE